MKNLLHLIRMFLRPAGVDFGLMTGSIVGTGLAATSPMPNYPMPQGGQQADAAWQQAMQAIAAATDRNTGMVDPVLLQSYSQMLGIDLTPLVTSGAAAGGMYQQLGAQAGGASGQMMGAGGQIMTSAFDPQQQLYERERQRTVEDVRGAESARGIAMGGQGAGLESDALRNFNIDWRNYALGREIQGSQAAGQAYGQGMQFGAQQPAYTMAGAAAPIAGQEAAYGAPMGYSTQFLGAENAMMQPGYNVMGAALPYAQYATGASAQRYGLDLAGEQNRYNQWMQAQEMAGRSGAGKPENWVFGGGMPSMGGGGGAGMMAG